jgi:LacI family transcriptional regulator
MSDDDDPIPRPKGRATMKDVARLAGVGIKTVSRVVNEEAYVAPATAARVERAMAELNYRRDLAAGNLRRSDRRSRTLGLLLANVANPFDSVVHRAAEDVAQELGVSVLSASHDERADREGPFVHAFATRRVDGLILMPASPDHAYLAAEIVAGMPIVFVDRPPIGLEADCVVVDNAGGARQAVQHLASFGHRRIAFLGDRPTLATAAGRLAGYLEGVEAVGLSSAASPTIDGLTNEYVAESAVRALFEASDPPTALFSAQNLVTIGAIRALRSLGLEREVAVVGFDDLPLGDLLQPAITVIAQDPIQIGRLAAQRVFARIDGDDSPAQRVVVPTRFIVRGSGEIPAPS